MNAYFIEQRLFEAIELLGDNIKAEKMGILKWCETQPKRVADSPKVKIRIEKLEQFYSQLAAINEAANQLVEANKQPPTEILKTASEKAFFKTEYETARALNINRAMAIWGDHF